MLEEHDKYIFCAMNIHLQNVLLIPIYYFRCQPQVFRFFAPLSVVVRETYFFLFGWEPFIFNRSARTRSFGRGK